MKYAKLTIAIIIPFLLLAIFIALREMPFQKKMSPEANGLWRIDLTSKHRNFIVLECQNDIIGKDKYISFTVVSNDSPIHQIVCRLDDLVPCNWLEPNEKTKQLLFYSSMEQHSTLIALEKLWSKGELLLDIRIDDEPLDMRLFSVYHCYLQTIMQSVIDKQ